jgi:DNA-directed RNA polymerase specialized sigma24 family protein
MVQRLARLLPYLQRLTSPPDSDAVLLDRFIRLRDEAAFSLLVRRHGPMVFRICCRVLREIHAAEDAFQATFLVLARRAGFLARPAALAAWLYGVASRVALKARARQQMQPVDPLDPADPHPDPLATLSTRDFQIQGWPYEWAEFPKVRLSPLPADSDKKLDKGRK